MIYCNGNNIIQSGDTLRFWAFVTDVNGGCLSNQDVVFYTVKDGVKTQIGSPVVTGSNGIAVCAYVGRGMGDICIMAETEIEGSFVSEPSSVLDCEFYDDGITDPKTAIWYNYDNLINVSISNNGTSLTPSQAYVGYTANNGELFSYPFEVEFTVVDNSVTPQIRCSNNQGNISYVNVKLVNGNYKILVQESGITAFNNGERVTNYGAEWNHEDMNIKLYFDSASDRITFKDFKVYPI